MEFPWKYFSINLNNNNFNKYIFLSIFHRIFEKIRQYFGAQSESIPMSFVLGFYVSLIVKRWWEQYKLLPWPDTLALFISAAIPGNVSDDRYIFFFFFFYFNIVIMAVITVIIATYMVSDNWLSASSASTCACTYETMIKMSMYAENVITDWRQ